MCQTKFDLFWTTTLFLHLVVLRMKQICEKQVCPVLMIFLEASIYFEFYILFYQKYNLFNGGGGGALATKKADCFAGDRSL